MIRWWFLVLWVSVGAGLVRADSVEGQALVRLLRLTGVNATEAAPETERLISFPTVGQQLSLYKQVMAYPLKAPYRLGLIADELKRASTSPFAALALTGTVAGLNVALSREHALRTLEDALASADDPLAVGVAGLLPKDSGTTPWLPRLPDKVSLPEPLRLELAMVLSAMGRANHFLDRALAQIPSTATPALLRRQALDGTLYPFEEPDYRTLLPLVEHEALLSGMLELTAAVERLQLFVTTQTQLPAVDWSLDTPMGKIVVDTTGRNNRHLLTDALLVLDVGGDDIYEFAPPSDKHRISVLLDHKGNDRYIATTPGADPSSATLGYGILWDTEGDDTYEGTQHAQASALFGVALLADGGGHNHYSATSHAQAHAVAGLALLLGSPGDDIYLAQTHSQGSAGPQGVAVLLERAGDDSYTLGNEPLLRPSPQLPSHNTSMGQGAGRGIRADSSDGRSVSGGIGMLLDFAGHDRYMAQVFAQGAGYYQGLGILLDDDGDDHFEAAWYAMGAAAHQGAGVLVKRGGGNDHYRASHSTSLGAAHDFSVGIFVDEAGNDTYELGDLGLGAAHDNSTAMFVDGKGNDRYTVDTALCRAFGSASLSAWGGLREDLGNLGLFMDLGGSDIYPKACPQSHNNQEWQAVQRWPELKLKSEAGGGLDGEFALPFALRARTR